MDGISPNITTSSEDGTDRSTAVELQQKTSTITSDSTQELIRTIGMSTVIILNEKISRTDCQTTSEQLVGTRTSLQQILSSENSISSSHSSFILDAFNENRDTNTLLGVAGVIGCLYFRIQVLVDANPDSNEEILTDVDFFDFIRNCQIALNDFYRQVSPEDVPEDLQIYHLKIRNIAKLLTWWLKKPYSIGNECKMNFLFQARINCAISKFFTLKRPSSTSLRCALYGQ